MAYPTEAVIYSFLLVYSLIESKLFDFFCRITERARKKTPEIFRFSLFITSGRYRSLELDSTGKSTINAKADISHIRVDGTWFRPKQKTIQFQKYRFSVMSKKENFKYCTD
jgi:hypothetical protein